jgi:hypothetical protein
VCQPRSEKVVPALNIILQLALPNVFRVDVLMSYHECVVGGCYFGIQRTFLAIKRKLFWHGYYQDVLKYVRSRDCCQRIKVDRHTQPTPLINMPINKPFGHLGACS